MTVEDDTIAAEKFVQQLQHITDEGGYSPQQISKIEQITLFWEKMASGTYIS